MKKKLLLFLLLTGILLLVLNACSSTSMKKSQDFNHETNQLATVCGLTYEVPEAWEEKSVDGQGDNFSYFYSATGMLMVTYEEGVFDASDLIAVSQFQVGIESGFDEFTERNSFTEPLSNVNAEAAILDFSGTVSEQDMIGRYVVFGYNNYIISFMYADLNATNFIGENDFEQVIDSIQENSEIAGLTETSTGLLPFDFTAEEYYNTISQLASTYYFTLGEANISNNDLSRFVINAVNGKSIVVFLTSESGKVINIDAAYDSESMISFPSIAEAIVLSADSSLDFGQLNSELNFGNPPFSAIESKTTRQNGLCFVLGGGRFTIQRDTETQNEPSGKMSSESENLEDKTSAPDQSTAPSSISSSQSNALSSANNYLNFMSFSRSGLIDQLEYEGFSTEDATYAVDHCGADWMEQAVLSAKNYLNTSAFSYTGLIDQLEYEGFSSEEATHGADNCGADWYEQATKCAQNYLKYSSFSHSELVDQLEYEGFTSDQAEHGVSSAGL